MVKRQKAVEEEKRDEIVKKVKLASEMTAVSKNVRSKGEKRKKSQGGNEVDTAAKKSKDDTTVVEKKDSEELKTEKSDLDEAKTKELLTHINEQARVGVAALLKWVSDKEEKALFPELEHAINLLVTYKKPQLVNGPTQRKRIILPHPSIDPSTAMFCVILPDLDLSQAAKRDADVEKQAREWQDRIEAEQGLTSKHIAKIMTQHQLWRTTRTYNDRRKLATAYDVFLVEKRCHKAVQNTLGKEFIKAHKMPLTFDYEGAPLAETLKKAAATSIYDLSANRIRVSVSVGHLAQAYGDIVSNLEHVLNEVTKHCPGGISNIRSLFVQLSSSNPSIPIYCDDTPAPAGRIKVAPKKNVAKRVKDELSTLPEGLGVEVYPDGRVRVIKEENSHTVLYPTNKDEWEKRDDFKPVDLEKRKKKQLKKKAAVAKREKRKSGTEESKKGRRLMHALTLRGKAAEKAKKEETA